MAALRRTPGLNKHQLCERLDIDPQALAFHLERLEAHEIAIELAGVREGERLCFLVQDADRWQDLWEDEDTRILF